MAEKGQKRTKDKWKRKIWYEIFAPKIFNQKKVGETVAEKPELLNGRVITVSLREIINQPKKGHLMMKFKINNVQGSKAYTELTGHEIVSSYLKRIIRRNVSKVEAVNDFISKDNKKIRVKAVVITQKKVPKKQETDIRKIIIETIEEEAKHKNYEELINEFVFGGTPSGIFNKAKKISLIKRVEVLKSRP